MHPNLRKSGNKLGKGGSDMDIFVLGEMTKVGKNVLGNESGISGSDDLDLAKLQRTKPY